MPYLKIINSKQGYIRKYEDLKTVMLVMLFAISKDGSVVSFSGPPITAQRYYVRNAKDTLLKLGKGGVGNKKVTFIRNPPYQRLDSEAGISC
jgi:hypothetical protein